MWNPYLELRSSIRRRLGLLAVISVVCLWWLTSFAVGSLFLPSPWEVLKALIFLSWDSTRGSSILFPALVASCSRVFVSSLLMIAVGIPFGVAMGASPKINAFFSPLVDPFRSAPVVALIPIFVIWFGIDEGMKIAFLFFGAIVFLIPAVRDAVAAVPSEQWISARDLGFSPFETVKEVLWPLSQPRIADATIASISLMWTYITVAEYVNAGAGLGQMIQTAKRFSAMDQVFAGIFVIILLALITYQGLTFLKKRLFWWEL